MKNEMSLLGKQYLASDQTYGRSQLSEQELNQVESFSFFADRNEIMPNLNTQTAVHLSSSEIKLVESLQKSVVDDEGMRTVCPLSSADIKLLKKINLSEEEIAFVLAGKQTVAGFAHLHQLSAFEERAKKNHEFELEMKKVELDWPLGDGDYGREYGSAKAVWIPNDNTSASLERKFWLQAQELPEDVEFGELIGEELTIASIIQQRLKEKKLTDFPLIMLDVGGMLSVSWIRLAKHFEHAVQDGNVLFVTTSLGADVDECIQRIKGYYYSTGPYTSRVVDPESEEKPPYLEYDELKFIEDNKHLVVSVKMDLIDLLTLNIKGTNLLRNVAVICDMNAISLHSRIPSLHLALLIALLDEKGVYINNDTGATEKEDSHQSREAELERSRKIIEKEMRIERVWKVEGGSKLLVGKKLSTVFLRQPNGPAITAYLPSERHLVE